MFSIGDLGDQKPAALAGYLQQAPQAVGGSISTAPLKALACGVLCRGFDVCAPVIVALELRDSWLSAGLEQAGGLMTCAHMPELTAAPAPRC